MRALLFPWARLMGCLLICFWAGACGEASELGRQPPHILFILVDDMGFGDVGYHGAEFPTPAIDQLADHGLRLESFYSSPMCTPARAQFLTGRHALRMDLHRNINLKEDHGLPAAELTLPELLRTAGYATSMVGKWHLGHVRPEHHPTQQGFDHFYGHLGGWIDYSSHQRAGRTDWQRDGQTLEEEGYATQLLAEEAMRVIREHEEAQPLFLYLSFNAPHAPLHVAPGSTAAGRNARALYRTMMIALDRAIGQVLAELDHKGMAANTLVLFASDNGGNLSMGASNGALRGGKYETFEGGVRTPAIMRWPGHLPGGELSHQRLSNLDILPTLIAAAGIEHPAPASLDGESVLAELSAGRERQREPLLLLSMAKRVEHAALIDEPWKLVREVPAQGQAASTWLFQLETDEYEQQDMSAEEPEVRARLSATIEELMPAAGTHSKQDGE